MEAIGNRPPWDNQPSRIKYRVKNGGSQKKDAAVLTVNDG